MRKHVSQFVEIEVELALEEFDDADLLEEMESRGYTCTKGEQEPVVTVDAAAIFEAARYGTKEQLERAVSDLVWQQAGRIL